MCCSWLNGKRLQFSWNYMYIWYVQQPGQNSRLHPISISQCRSIYIFPSSKSRTRRTRGWKKWFWVPKIVTFPGACWKLFVENNPGSPLSMIRQRLALARGTGYFVTRPWLSAACHGDLPFALILRRGRPFLKRSHQLRQEILNPQERKVNVRHPLYDVDQVA